MLDPRAVGERLVNCLDCQPPSLTDTTVRISDMTTPYCKPVVDYGVVPSTDGGERGKARLCKGLNAVLILLLCSDILPHH